MDIYERSRGLVGEDVFASLQKAKVAIFGLGGVGGTSAEALLRSGIVNLTLIDFDVVSASNLNRQLLYTSKSIGKEKAEEAKARLLNINPEAQIETISERVKTSFFSNHDFSSFDYIVDAIDDVDAKAEIASYCLEKQIPFLSCLGMANRLDPSQVELTSLDKTEGDPLAKKVRTVFRKKGLDISKIQVVFSKETPFIKGKTPCSMMMVPSEAGLLIDSVVILSLAKRPLEE